MKKQLLTTFILSCLSIISMLNAQVLLQTFDTNTLPTGWSVATTSGLANDEWTLGQAGAAGYTAGTAAEHTGNNGYYLWTDFTDINPGDTSDLISPQVDVSTLTTPTVYFWLYSHYVGTSTPNPYNTFFVSAWDGTDWNIVGTIQGDNGGWTQYAFDVSAYTFGTTATVQLKFSTTTTPPSTNDYNNDLLLDDISVDEALSCAWPTNLGAYNNNGYGADVYWTESGSATSWELEIVPQGSALGTGIRTVETNDTVVYTGLTPSSSYNMYVRAICGSMDTSSWSGPVNFLTTCAPFTPTYNQDFDGYTTAANIPDCWEEYTAGTPSTGPQTPGSGNWTYDDWGNVTSSTNNAAKIYISGTTTSDWMVSPEFDLSGTSGPFQLDFDVQVTDNSSSVNSSGMGADDTIQLLITTDAGLTWTPLLTWEASNVPAFAGDYTVVDLTAYTGIVQFGFWASSGSVSNTETYDFMFDNFRVRPIPSCITPSSLAGVHSYNGTDFDFQFTWVDAAASMYEVEYGATGFTPGSGTSTIVNMDTFINILGGFAPTTTYDFYVRAICGPGDTSIWSSITYTMPCAPFTPTYVQDFNSYTSVATIPTCWEEYTAGTPSTGPQTPGSGNWTYDDWGNVTSSTNNAAKIYISGTTTSDWMVSPEFDLSGTGGPYQLDFDAMVIDGYSSVNPSGMGADDTIQLLITTDAGLTWSPLFTWEAGNVPPMTGNYFVADLTAYTGVVQFGFWASSGSVSNTETYDFMFDNFRIRPIPACPEPFNLVVNSITFNSAELEWDDIGTPNSWIIEYGVQNFAVGTGTVVDLTTNPGIITGLSGNMTYDFYVRSNCGTDTSNYLAVATATTLCAPLTAPFLEDFESVAPALSGDLGNCWLASPATGFRWESENSTGANENSTSTGPFYDKTLGSTPGGIYMYTEASNSGDSAFLTSPVIDLASLTAPRISFWYHMYGQTMGDLVVQVTNDYVNWSTLSLISGEQQTSGDMDWLNQKVDLTAYAGDTIQIRFVGIKGTNYYSDMSIDDVAVEETPTNDISVIEIVSPSANDCGSVNSPLVVSVTGYGSSTQYNVPVTMELVGDYAGVYTTTVDSIQFGDTLLVYIDTIDNSAGGVSTITAYSSSPGDQVLGNDTIVGNGVVGFIPASIVAGNQTSCSGDSVTYTNTSGFNVRWILAANDSIVSEEDTFTVAPNVTTQYEVEVYSVDTFSVGHAGPSTSSLTTTSTYYGIAFEAQQDFVINSVVVYPNGTGTITVGLYDEASGLIIDQVTANVTDGGTPYSASVAVLNMEVPVSATPYRLVYLSGLGVTNIGRNTTGSSFPYVTSNGLLTLTNSTTSLTGTSTTAYYYFYDWNVSFDACPSDRTAFTVNVQNSVNDTVTVVTCDSYVINGTVVTTSGFYTENYTTTLGCDSIINTDLTILNSVNTSQSVIFCTADSIAVGNNVYSATGVYVDTLATVYGCDSVVTTNLTISNIVNNLSISGISPQVCLNTGVVLVELNPLGGILSGNGVSSNVFDPTDAGVGVHTLTYDFIDSLSCLTSVSADVEVIVCTGISEISGIESVTIFPNPFVSEINLNFVDTKSGNLNISLFDALGKLVYMESVSTQFGANNIVLDVPANIASGVTFLQVERDGSVYNTSLIKE